MGVVENARELADLIKKVGDVELYRRIVELEGEVIDLAREKRRLEEQVGALEQRATFVGKLQFRAPFYFHADDHTPYCPRCWEVDHNIVHLVHQFGSVSEGRWDCPECQRHW